MPKLPRSAGSTRSQGRTKSVKAAKKNAQNGRNGGFVEQREVGHGSGGGNGNGAVAATIELNEFKRGLLGDLFAVVEEHAGDAADQIDRKQVEHAFVFACERHADQRRQSGEDFIVHPVGVAKICGGMRIDTATLCAALLHVTGEDTISSLPEVRDDIGEEIAALVDGVTKLTGITFQSRD